MSAKTIAAFLARHPPTAAERVRAQAKQERERGSAELDRANQRLALAQELEAIADLMENGDQ
jgi:hypothetical protein